jgi:chromosome segregation ATPase
LQRLLYTVLRWLIGLFLAFLVGVLLIALGFYLPAQRQIKDLKAERDTLQTDLDRTRSALSELEGEKTGLQTDLDTLRLRATVLSALSDVTAARLALTTEGYNYANAQFTLTEASETLNVLATLVTTDDAKGVADLQKTMTQALDKLNGSTPKSAAADLDKLIDSLTTLQRKLLSLP